MTGAQAKIERSYQRAMNIRDSTPFGHDFKADEENEMWYTAMYRKCYRNAATLNKTPPHTFTRATRIYLRTLRKLAALKGA